MSAAVARLIDGNLCLGATCGLFYYAAWILIKCFFDYDIIWLTLAEFGLHDFPNILCTEKPEEFVK